MKQPIKVTETIFPMPVLLVATYNEDGSIDVMPQLQAHVRGALNMGVTEEQLQNIPMALKANDLQAEALRVEAAIAATVDGKTDVACAQSPWPIGEPNTAYAQYFTGNSYLDCFCLDV